MDDLKAAMKAGQTETVAQIRGITAKLKDLDVSARAKSAEVMEEDIVGALRSMIKSRAESASLYRQGLRPELAEKEENEIKTIQRYLPPALDDETLEGAIREALSSLGAREMKDMGKVMGSLKKRFGTSFDPAAASAKIKAHLS